MRKLLIPLIITLLSLISNNTFAQRFGGGTGTSTDPYKISTKGHLDSLAIYVNRSNSPITFSGKYFKINASFDVNGTSTPIGISATNSFQGIFDGGGYTLSALNTNSSVTYGGLFGYISGATIKNVKIGGGSNIGSGSNVGALVGYAVNSTIDSCNASANMSGRASCKLGGVIGYANNCTISNCSNYSSNFNSPGANGYYGGIVAYAENGSVITRCYSTSSINGANTSYMGGLVAYSDSSIINNCYFTGSVQNGSGYYGGLVAYGTNNSTISNSYSAPTNFPNGTNAGTLCGYFSTNSNIYNSYYLNSWPSAYGTSKNYAQMRTMQFASDLNACQNQTWRGFTNNYPVLYWQGTGTSLPRCLDGLGTEADPFRIRCVADLVTLSDNVNNNGMTYSGQFLIVENNIDFNDDPIGESNFNPIGNSSTNNFQGIFNGGENKISNLTINSGAYVGLFGNISGAKIESLGIEGFNITTANGSAGALVGSANNSEINGCYSANSTISGSRDWFNSPNIGGLIGYLDGASKINNSYSRSSVKALSADILYTSYVGGLVAYISNGSTISNSYSAPQSLGTQGTRGAFYANGTVTTVNSYYDNANNNSGITGLTSKSSAEMKSGCFVVSLNNNQNPIAWYKAKSQVNLGYPVLSWQKLSDGVTPAGFEGNCLVTNDGSSTNPYQVKYVKDMIYISNMVANDTTYNGEYFKMLNDISFIKYDNVNSVLVDSSSLYNPIGDFTNNKQFSGNFSGERFAIANYSFSDTTKDNIGLFGYIKGATIKRLGISNVSIKARNNVGGLVGNINANSAIGGCFVYGYINGVSNVGGLVGNATTASCNIDTSFTNTTIDALTNVGGLVGNHNGGTISNSYSNSEIYSSTVGNNYVGGIIGNASNASTLNNVYSVCKIIRNGTNTNFGKIKGNNLGSNTNCFSRDSVFVNYTNSSPTGYNGTSKTNAELRAASFVTNLNNVIWRADYSDNINNGYPIFTYQVQAVKPSASGLWPTTTASQVVIIKSGVQLKTTATNYPKCSYVKIEKGGELNNTTNLNLYGEYNRELYVGKWNLIGLSTYNKILSCLYNYADTCFKTFVKRFDYVTNNWSTTTITDINTQFKYGEGFLVMPNYSLDSRLLTKSRIISKGILYNENTSSYTANNAALGFVSLANNYPANLDTATFKNDNISLVQGGLIYVYDADTGKWNNNLNTNVRVPFIKPGEGFFIAGRATNATLGFRKSQLVNTSGAKNIIKSDLIYVKAFANNQERESFLEFNEEADNGFDFNDGLMLFGDNYYSVEPFFKIPTPEINDSTTQLIKDAFSSLPYSTELDLRSKDNNDVSLEFSNIPSGIYVYLIDSLLSKVQCLNENPYYSIKVSEGNNGNRLTVLFTYNKSDAKGFFNNNSNEEIRIWNNNKVLNIGGEDLVGYEIYDIMGNKLLEQGISSNNYQTLLNLKTGIYIVRVNSKTGLKSQKISVVSE